MIGSPEHAKEFGLAIIEKTGGVPSDSVIVFEVALHPLEKVTIKL
jgi:hypothetical protein